MKPCHSNTLCRWSRGAAVVAGLGVTALAWAAAGSPDPTFANHGRFVLFAEPGIYWAAQDVAIQKDGKLVIAAAYATIGITSDFLIYRLNSNGQPDPTFGDGGVTQLQLPDYELAKAVALQKDGKIVVVGTARGATSDFALVRLTTAGQLDSRFNGTGFVTTDFFNHGDYGGSVAIQKDGKIVVAGEIDTGSTSQGGIARYRPDGRLDTSFGTGGHLTETRREIHEFRDLALQKDGKILAAATVDRHFGVARYRSNGRPDSSFGSDGLASTQIGDGSSPAGIAVSRDGKIVLAGVVAYPTAPNDVGLVRYLTNGNVDPTFGDAGVITDDIEGTDGAARVALEQDGDVVIAGYTRFRQGDVSLLVARYLGR